MTDAASAQRAIDEILEQGEGPRGHWTNAHFGQFVEILDEYIELREANPAFEPVRPVVPVNVRPAERDTDIPLVSDPVTSRVMDLFNVSYEILLLMLQRFFARTEETPAQLKALADGTVALMFSAIRPLGDLVTTLPAGRVPRPHGRPQLRAVLRVRLRAAAPRGRLDPAHRAAAPGRGLLRARRPLRPRGHREPAARSGPALTGIADALAVHLPPRYAPEPADPPRTAPPCWPAPKFLPNGPGSRHRRQLRAHRGSRPPGARSTGPCKNPSRRHGISRSARPRCAPAWAPRPRPSCSRPSPSSRTWPSSRRRPGDRPARLAEPRPAPARAPARHRDRQERPLPGHQRRHGAHPARRGRARAATLALCRCGASATKPSCDGACATSGFTDDKDPKRVPDQRDTYPGTQVTIFDNRGICQHSGLCTDRAPTAFRTSAEPFVAPSGARLDELIRAVRNCPSGALSLAFDRTEERDLADWHGTRERAIEVTQDGPYRVTGGIPLTGADGAAVPRAQGSSLRALRPLPLRPLAEQAVLQRHALVRRVPRPGPARRPDPVRVGRRPARADPDDPAALREARPRRRSSRPAVRRHETRGSPGRGGRHGGSLRRARQSAGPPSCRSSRKNSGPAG